MHSHAIKLLYLNLSIKCFKYDFKYHRNLNILSLKFYLSLLLNLKVITKVKSIEK